MMLWLKVIVLLCILLDLASSSSYYYYRRGRSRYRHKHRYSCGLQKCVRRKNPPVCERWCLVFVSNGYCQEPIYTCCLFREKPGSCAASQNACVWPFPYHATKAYECRHDFNCPSQYKCCRDSCYLHKVCKSPVTSDFPEETVKPVNTTTVEIPTTIADVITTKEEEETTTFEETTTAIESTTNEEEEGETIENEVETTTKKEEEEAKTTTSTESIIITTTMKVTTRRPATVENTTDGIDGSGMGSGDGSGDAEVPQPEPARSTLRRDTFGVWNDDEDLF